MRVLKWTPDFNSAIESPLAPVWVRLPKLPYCLFHKAALVEIVNSIGKPLKVDHETEVQSRPAYARICVEMNVLHPRPDSVAIVMGEYCIEQKVIYENVPRYCVNCRHKGHDSKNCRWYAQEKFGKTGQKDGNEGKESDQSTAKDAYSSQNQHQETEDRLQNTHEVGQETMLQADIKEKRFASINSSEPEMRVSDEDEDQDNSILRDGKFISTFKISKDNCSASKNRYPIRSRRRKWAYLNSSIFND